MKKQIITFIIFMCFTFYCFPFLLSTQQISGGDYTQSTSLITSLVSNFWSWCDYSGLGFNCTAINLHGVSAWYLILFLHIVGLPTFLIERLVWWLPYFIVGYFSILLLSKKMFSHNFYWFLLTPFIYLFNTYILMVIGGGQITGIALGYAFVPLLLWSFIRLFERVTVKRIIVPGCILALLVVIDPRIAFIGYFACFLYALYDLFWKKKITRQVLQKNVLLVLLPPSIAVGLHAYWILPALVVHQNPLVQLGPAYSTTGAVSYFSFANFENALGLLHPNWPDNIFGKTYFMRPEFIMLPLLAFASLLFISFKKEEQRNNYSSIFLCLLALVGIFLAKGAQDPFGGFYLWIFSHVPGFQLFRDPTKWYIFIALSYTLLIPFTISKIIENMFLRNKKVLSIILISAFFGYFVWLIQPLVQHTLTGVFVSRQEPQEYKELNSFLASQPEFFRTLWIPSQQMFSLYSRNHPVLSMTDISPKMYNYTDLSRNKELIQDLAIQYIIIPYDSNKEIFLTNRHYDEKKYLETVDEIKKISWLYEYKQFGKILVFKVSGAKGKLFTLSDTHITYQENNPTKYIVHIINGQKGDKLIFSEGFDNSWVAKENRVIEKSIPFDSRVNGFTLAKNGDQTIDITYTPQQWVWVGLAISTIVFTVLIVLLFRI